MSQTATKSIWKSDSLIIPLKDVSFVENYYYGGKPERQGLIAVMKNTAWDMEAGTWANNAFIPERLADDFLSSWLEYRKSVDEPLLYFSPGNKLEPITEKTTRKVMVYEYDRDETGLTIKVEVGIGNFVQYGCDFEEFEAGPGNFTTAIVEMPDGTVRTPMVHMIKFLNEEEPGCDFPSVAEMNNS